VGCTRPASIAAQQHGPRLPRPARPPLAAPRAARLTMHGAARTPDRERAMKNEN
jgi:hypothetical protein